MNVLVASINVQYYSLGTNRRRMPLRLAQIGCSKSWVEVGFTMPDLTLDNKSLPSL